jgi:hypothetical protein
VFKVEWLQVKDVSLLLTMRFCYVADTYTSSDVMAPDEALTISPQRPSISLLHRAERAKYINYTSDGAAAGRKFMATDMNGSKARLIGHQQYG